MDMSIAKQAHNTAGEPTPSAKHEAPLHLQTNPGSNLPHFNPQIDIETAGEGKQQEEPLVYSLKRLSRELEASTERSKRRSQNLEESLRSLERSLERSLDLSAKPLTESS